MMVETSWSDSRTTFSNTAYQMFGAVMTMGNLFDMSSQNDEEFKVCNPNVIRLMFAAYFLHNCSCIDEHSNRHDEQHICIGHRTPGETLVLRKSTFRGMGIT